MHTRVRPIWVANVWKQTGLILLLDEHFVLDLLQSFKEELLNICPLVQDHLAKSFDVLDLSFFKLDDFPGVDYFFVLFLNYLFALKL